MTKLDDDLAGVSQRLSRSPHPYHRRGTSFPSQDGTRPNPSVACAEAQRTEASIESDAEVGYFDADHRKRRKTCEPSSDSGTEADDEKGPLLLGLPAPPLKPRKGLRDGNGNASPLLTPSYLDDDPSRRSSEIRAKRRASLEDCSASEAAAKTKEKFRRRRRAELIRRVTETTLFLLICSIATSENLLQAFINLDADHISSPPVFLDHTFRDIPSAAIVYVAIVVGLYIAYPLRIIWRDHSRSLARRRSRFYIHIPAAFDPAPLLYPVLLPAIAAWSIGGADNKLLVPNLIVGIGSIPGKIVPFNFCPWHSSPHWVFSIIPLTTTVFSNNGSLSLSGTRDLWPQIHESEALTLLYPLHQTLLPILWHLTTTSLLPAELQLFSACLVNLLLHSETPQSVILQTIIWVGAVLLLIICNKPLQWGVMLARIPSWRFRKPGTQMSQRSRLLRLYDHALGSLFLQREYVAAHEVSSDEENLRILKPLPQSVNKTMRARTATLDAASSAHLKKISTSPTSGALHDTALSSSNRNNKNDESALSLDRKRRNTMSPSVEPASEGFLAEKAKDFLAIQSSRSWSLRSLTKTQATALRWVLALYVYAVAFLVIAFPIREHVGKAALHGKEPLGWALGYLFNGSKAFQDFVRRCGLAHWIPLMEEKARSSSSRLHSTLARNTLDSIGAANARLCICVYCVLIIILGLMMVLRLSKLAEVDTRRKVFHGMMVAMFLPTIFIDPAFISLALTLILAIFLLLDLFRASQLPPIAKPLTNFLAPYVDGRDHRGPVIVSHIFLLIGCAIPLWLSLAAAPRTGEGPWAGWEVPRPKLDMISGVVCVGMGDAAASLIGRRYGRRRWCWSGGKSLEGSLAFAVAVVCGLSAAHAWLVLGGWEGVDGKALPSFLMKACIAASGASLTEAVLTGGNDNVIVPIILWLLVRGLGL